MVSFLAQRVSDHGPRTPSERVGATVSAVFYPGEAARLLGVPDIDYAQLIKLHRLARESRGLKPSSDKRWTRFDFMDLACIHVLIELGGGTERLQVGRRLVLGNISATCAALRQRGVKNPLLDVPLKRVGRSIVAKVDGYVFEPDSGQAVMALVEARLQEFAAEYSLGKNVLGTLRRERKSAMSKQTRVAVNGADGQVPVATDDQEIAG